MAMASLSPTREDRAFIPRFTLAPDERALYLSSRKAEEENHTIWPLPASTETARVKGPSRSPSSLS